MCRRRRRLFCRFLRHVDVIPVNRAIHDVYAGYVVVVVVAFAVAIAISALLSSTFVRSLSFGDDDEGTKERRNVRTNERTNV